MSKGKGSAYERDFCKRLSLWFSGNRRDDIFWRSQNSGGRATQRKKTQQTTYGQSGDIQAVDPIGQPLMNLFTIELKKGYPSCHPSEPFITNKKNTVLEQFIRQAVTQKSAPYWMLFHKGDRKNEMLYMSEGIARVLMRASGNYPERWMTLRFSGFSVFCGTSDFLFDLKPKMLINKVGELL